MKKINSTEYWNERFSSGDWKKKAGYSQTQQFAISQVSILDIDPCFDGSICDFGCGAGDSIPVFHAAYKKAKLYAVDHSEAGIELARNRFGSLASFAVVENGIAIECDIVIASNVFEHIVNEGEVLQNILEKCKFIYIIVPYHEIHYGGEHVRCYEIDHYDDEFEVLNKWIFLSKGWGYHGLKKIWELYLKNFARILLGKPMLQQNYQICYKIKGKL